MSDIERFRDNAQKARDYAERAPTADDAEFWRTVAEGWLKLLPVEELTPEQAFDVEARARGTGQSGGTSRH
jgi:hypothetical protein